MEQQYSAWAVCKFWFARRYQRCAGRSTQGDGWCVWSGFDRFCDPAYIAPGTNGLLTGAMSGASHAGRWFKEGFKVLLVNAYPPL